MRHFKVILILLVLAAIACQAMPSFTSTAPAPTAGLPSGAGTLAVTPGLPSATLPSTIYPSPSALPATILPPTVRATLEATASPSPAATGALPGTDGTPLSLTSPNAAGYSIRVEPEEGLYVGDLASFILLSPPNTDPNGKAAKMQIDGEPGKTFGPASFGGYAIDNRAQAIFQWAWDTKTEQPGPHTVTASIMPNGPTFTVTVELQPAAQVPPPQPQAHWATAKSKCCILYYITGTAAERDIHTLLQEADQQAQDASRRFGAPLTQPITATLLARTLGQGGFAGDEISVSYLDRDYSGTNFPIVLHHEMIHILDLRAGGDLRPTIFQEGLAVYLTGGHFKPENLLANAATLLDMNEAMHTNTGMYIPLTKLADNFYPSQHEIGYLEAAALVEYMVGAYGWMNYNAFYRDIHPDPGGSQAKAIDTALRKHFNITFADLEANFQNDLRAQEVTPAEREDVTLEVQYYNTMRRYQTLMDPAAYFRTVWLLNNVDMRKRGIVADYLRHPSAPENIALETLLVAAEQTWRGDQYAQTRPLLDAANAVMNAIQRGDAQPFSANPLAQNYYSIVQVLAQAGYQAQQIQASGDTAQVKATRGNLLEQLVDLKLARQGGMWVIK